MENVTLQGLMVDQTVYGCPFQWARKCLYAEKNSQDSQAEYLTNIVLSNQMLGEYNTLGSWVKLGDLQFGTMKNQKKASINVYWKMLPDIIRTNIKIQKGKRCYKFGNGEVLLLINQVTLLYISADMVQADMYSKASM